MFHELPMVFHCRLEFEDSILERMATRQEERSSNILGLFLLVLAAHVLTGLVIGWWAPG
jgi:hypothetical protein